MTEITLNSAQRIALKAAILAAAKRTNPPDLADIRATFRNWSKGEILAYAERFDIAVPPADTGSDAYAAHPADAGSDTTDSAPETDAPEAPMVDPAVKQDLDTLDKLWAAMDIAGYRQKLSELATRANEPKTTIVQAAISGAPLSTRIGMRKANTIFANLGGTLAGDLDLPIYDTPDAPPVDKHFAFPPTLSAVLSRTVKRGKAVFLYGPPGTGKTTLAQQVAARLGRPFVRISCNGQTDAATLVGMTVPTENGGTTFQPGILAHAIQRPGVVLLIDEITTARDGVAYVLQSLLDDAKAIFIDECGGLIYRLAPDAMIFLADNTDGNGDTTGRYAGTRPLSSAIRNRVAMIPADYMPPPLEARVLVSRTRCSSALAALLIDFASVSRVKANDGEIPEAVGFRDLVTWAEYLCDGETPQTAAELAFLNGAAPDAREILQQLLTTHCAPERIQKAI